jgi:hypothetical protein
MTEPAASTEPSNEALRAASKLIAREAVEFAMAALQNNDRHRAFYFLELAKKALASLER